MTLRIKRTSDRVDIVSLVEEKGDVRVEINGDTIIYFHSDGRARFYPKDINSTINGSWKEETK